MKLTGEEGVAFELTVESYEFPEIEDEPWDSNWLLVRGRIKHPRGSWSFFEPCLTTWEIELIARWLERLVTGEVSRSALDFNEPNLRFLFAVQPVFAVEVRFAYECAPPWIDPEIPTMEGVGVLFPLSFNDLKEAARNLRQNLLRFPPRDAPIDLDKVDLPTRPSH